MSEGLSRVEFMVGDVRRRRWTTERKLQIIEESFAPDETVSTVSRRHGVGPNLLYRWRRLLSEGGAMAVSSDESVIGTSEVKKLEDRIRDLERLLGRKTLENEILREAPVPTSSARRCEKSCSDVLRRESHTQCQGEFREPSGQRQQKNIILNGEL